MNKEVNFSRFVGIAIIIISTLAVILTLLFAIVKNENNDNIIHVDDGNTIKLNIPKSNVITEYVNINKIIEVQDRDVALMISLPKINIKTDVTDDINSKIYGIYQNIYSELTKNIDIKEVSIDYSYDYLDNDTKLQIVITSKVILNDGKEEETTIKHTYDIQSDIEI